jgi:RNA polymerase sigma-70 factor (ECF subfamily)
MKKEKAFNIPSAVSKLREGDEVAFSQLFEFFRPKVFNTSRKMNLGIEDAEEIVQEVFLIIWKNRSNLNSELSFNAYLLTILKSLIIKKSKREAMRIAIDVYAFSSKELESNETENEIEFVEFEKISYCEIEKLPASQQKVFKMKNFENLHSGEIAEKLGISKRTVENHIYVATKSLKDKLQKKYLIAIKSLVLGLFCYFL